MCREAAVYLPEVRDSLGGSAESVAAEAGIALARLIYPPSGFDADAKAAQAARLTEPQVAQIALGALCSGLVDALDRVGLRPDRAAGHSYGELIALYAAGAMGRDDLCAFVRAAWQWQVLHPAACAPSPPRQK